MTLTIDHPPKWMAANEKLRVLLILLAAVLAATVILGPVLAGLDPGIASTDGYTAYKYFLDNPDGATLLEGTAMTGSGALTILSAAAGGPVVLTAAGLLLF